MMPIELDYVPHGDLFGHGPERPDVAAGLAAGEARKQEGLAMLRDRRAIYVRRGQRALLACLLRRGTATADDVRDVVTLPEGIDPRLFGSVPGTLAQAGIIESVGFQKTSRAAGHARPVTIWRLLDREKALAWLAANPPHDGGDDRQTASTTNEKSPTAATVGQELKLTNSSERNHNHG
jgi:hypothetical protein